MNKKIFAIILVSIFLLSAISFVSAEETSDSGNDTSHSITVKINWNDNGKTDARPDSVTITLIKDGEVIGNKTLNESNSWKTTFNVTEDGNYSVKQITNLSNYSVSIDNSSKDEIVITNTLNDSTSGEPQENDSSENANKLAAVVIEESAASDNNSSSNETNPTNNTTDNNSTNNITNNTTTNNTTNNTANNTANNTSNDTANNTTVNKDTPKPVPKKEDNRPTELMKVGIPIIILLIAIFVAVILKR